MSELQIHLPAMHKGQAKVDKSDARFIVLCCGRRWGKDIYAERKLILSALDKRYPVAWFAPTYKLLQENWRRMRHILQPITTRASDSEHRIELITGNPLEMWSLDNPDSGRGRKYGGVVINEAAMVKDLYNTWNMVIRPTLADYRGWAIFPSTPRGLNGYFELWKQSAENDNWARFKFRTDDNPHIPKEEVEEMRSTLPDRVIRQELDAEFIEDGAFFQGVDKAAVIEAFDNPDDHTGHYLMAGIDWAMAEDYTVLTIYCRECNRVIFWDRFNQLDYIYQRERIINSLKRYGVFQLLPERNSIGQPNIELLMQQGFTVITGLDGNFGFNTTATTKPQLIQQLADGLAVGGMKVPLEYADELRSYQVITSASGHPSFSAPSGYHDDCVISLALAYWGATRYVRSGVDFV